MHAAAFSPRGGVAPKTTFLRGQSIIEYVLIIAVIGLVVVFAGPQVSGAIRNQFNQVANTVDSGTDGDSFMSAEEKAYREAMKTVAQKEAKDWTLDEQKAAADDIAKNGISSVVYAKAKAAMDARTEWSVWAGSVNITYRIIGVNHDDLSDGSGKAGLTFFTTKNSYTNECMNDSKHVSGSWTSPRNTGGWEKSELRQKMNAGKIWSYLPPNLKSKIVSVKKITDNQGGGSAGTPTATTDKVFLLSSTEIWGNIDCDGRQYEYFSQHGIGGNDFPDVSFTRSVSKDNQFYFACANSSGQCIFEYGNYGISQTYYAFCF